MINESFVIKYNDHLQVIINKYGNRSPEKTQAQLKAAVVRLLDTIGYHNMRISTICEEAGLAKGTFYTRFLDKEDIIFNILSEYIKIQCQLMPNYNINTNTFEALHQFNIWFAKTFRENSGIHRTLMQLSETMPKISVLWDDFLTYITGCYRDILEDGTKIKIDDKLITLIVYSMGGMLDQALYAIYATHRSKNYKKAAINIEHLVETITLLQYRSIMLENPDSDLLSTSIEISKLKA